MGWFVVWAHSSSRFDRSVGPFDSYDQAIEWVVYLGDLDDYPIRDNRWDIVEG